jgi:ribosomal protein S18 acetylase RimI-like enzyme
MTGVTVRRAVTGDEQALSGVAARTFPLACPPHTSAVDIARHQRTELSVAQFAADMVRPGVVFHVAEFAGKVVGYTMMVGPVPPPDGPAGHNPAELRRIYVDADQQGRGVGDHLMRTVLHHARTHGYDQVWLGTNQLNERAIGFYTRHSFEVIGAKKFHVGAAVEDDYVMARTV